MKIPSLKDTDAWSPGSILPPGWHVCAVDEATEGKSQGGYPQFRIRLRAIEGPNQDEIITDWLTVTQASLGRVKQALIALGLNIPEGEFDLQVSQLQGKRAKILVKEEPKRDGTGNRSVVAAYQSLEGAPAAAGNGGSSRIGDPAPGEPEIPF